MTDTADPVLRLLDERAAEARGFFDIEPSGETALPPPPPVFAPVFPPAAIPIAAPNPVAPALPQHIPAMPSHQPNAPFQYSPGVLYQQPSPPTRRKKSSGVRRFFSWLIVLAIVGGMVYAGVRFGPDLMDRAQGNSTNDEASAPLAFPPVVPAATPARTGTIKVVQPADNGSTMSYEVTYDFESGVSRMLIDRATMPDVEVLAVFDVANLRRIDQPLWYTMPRGGFPFPDGAERQRWLRSVDDYLPPSIRPFVTIDRATESILGTETTRHLVVTIDAAGLAAASALTATDPVTGLQVPAAPAAPGQFTLPTSITGSTEALGPVTVEMWVDSNGMIRQLAEPPEIGGRTITVVSTSADAFAPTFPAAEATTPLTAGELVDFAL